MQILTVALIIVLIDGGERVNVYTKTSGNLRSRLLTSPMSSSDEYELSQASSYAPGYHTGKRKVRMQAASSRRKTRE